MAKCRTKYGHKPGSGAQERCAACNPISTWDDMPAKPTGAAVFAPKALVQRVRDRQDLWAQVDGLHETRESNPEGFVRGYTDVARKAAKAVCSEATHMFWDADPEAGQPLALADPRVCCSHTRQAGEAFPEFEASHGVEVEFQDHMPVARDAEMYAWGDKAGVKRLLAVGYGKFMYGAKL